MKAESSTISTRNFLFALVAMDVYATGTVGRASVPMSCSTAAMQLIFLHRFRQEGCSAFFHGAIAMLCARARSNDHHRNAPRRGALAQLHHQFVACHARHFEVGDHQVAAVLRNQFRGFHAVGGELHAVAILFQHAADKLAHADGIVGDDDHAFLLDAIDRFGGNRAARHGRRTRRKDARRAGAGLQRRGVRSAHSPPCG